MTSITDELKPSKTIRTSAAVLAEIESVPIEMRIARSVAIGTDLEAAEHERGCVICLTNHNGGETSIDDPQSMRGKYMNLGNELAKASNLRFLASLLAADPDIIEARKKLDPLFAELTRAQAKEAKERAELATARQELANAKAAALARAQAEIEAQFASV